MIDESGDQPKGTPDALAKPSEHADDLTLADIAKAVEPILAGLSQAQVRATEEQARVQVASINANREVEMQRLKNWDYADKRSTSTNRLVLVIPALMVAVAGVGYLLQGDAEFAKEVFKLILYGGAGFAAGWGAGRARSGKTTTG